MDAISTFLGRISNYNLLNNLIPGAILCVIVKYLVGYDFIVGNVLEQVIIFYFAGMVNSRVGSLIVEWLLKKTCVVKFRSHEAYITAEEKDQKISSLSEINNMYRSLISVSFIAILLKLYKSVFENKFDFGLTTEWVLLGALLVLFILSYRKQTRYIVARIDHFVSLNK